MIMRYKLANKRTNNGEHSAPFEDVSTAPHTSLPSYLGFGILQPKRVSLGTISTCSNQSLVYAPTVMESPMPMVHAIQEKPCQQITPSIVSFPPINNFRRLAFENPIIQPMLDGIDWSQKLLRMPQPPKAAAIVSPRLSPDSTLGPRFPNRINIPTDDGLKFPPKLCIPTGDETVAVELLMSLKERTDNTPTTLEEKEVEAPTLSLLPKSRREKISSAAKEVCHDLREEVSFPQEVMEEEDSCREPPNKKRMISRSVASRGHNARVCIEVPQPVVTLGSRSTSNKKERTASLSMPEDSNELNSLHCFVRSDLLEVFSLDDDSNKRGRMFPRVGIRCVHCGHLSRKEKEGASMSIFYPKSLQDIYRSVCTWQRIHFKACKHVPRELIERYDYFKDMDRTRGKKQHWVESAYRLGLRNLDENRGGIVWATDEQK